MENVLTAGERCPTCESANLNKFDVDAAGGHYPIWWCEDCGSLVLGSNTGGPLRVWQSEKTHIHNQVMAFHKRFGQAIGEKPHIVDDKTMRFRLSLVAEEFFELLDAAGYYIGALERGAVDHNDLFKHKSAPISLPLIVDALADLDYVIEGFRITLGVNGKPIADEVHRANMAKLPSYVAAKDATHGMVVEPEIALPLAVIAAAVGEPVKRPDGKIMKPPGWKPPDIYGELKKQNWGCRYCGEPGCSEGCRT